jgi:uncharacterized membrane protein YgaE (UPF0421/DUF939 family)
MAERQKQEVRELIEALSTAADRFTPGKDIPKDLAKTVLILSENIADKMRQRLFRRY